ncbi:MAG: hypothetical protein Q8L41_06805 [Anaerolineales bacterium]|nr:hypothetical protein [Anaerolineales bacterium]
METNKALIGALIFIALVAGANFIMYAIAHGAARSNQKSFLETVSQSLNVSPKKKNESLDELRHKIQELEEGQKKDTGVSD